MYPSTVGQGRPISLTAVFVLRSSAPHAPSKVNPYISKFKKPPLGGFLNLLIKNPVANNYLPRTAPVGQRQNQITTNLSDVILFYPLF